jgi:hypothetical protein
MRAHCCRLPVIPGHHFPGRTPPDVKKTGDVAGHGFTGHWKMSTNSKSAIAGISPRGVGRAAWSDRGKLLEMREPLAAQP